MIAGLRLIFAGIKLAFAALGAFFAFRGFQKSRERDMHDPEPRNPTNQLLELLVRTALGFVGFLLGVALWGLNDSVFLGGATVILSVLIMLFARGAGNIFVRFVVGIVLGILLWLLDQYIYVGASTVVLSLILMLVLANGRHVFLAFLAGILAGVGLWYLDEFVYIDGSILFLSIGTMLAMPLPRMTIPRVTMPKFGRKTTTVKEEVTNDPHSRVEVRTVEGEVV